MFNGALVDVVEINNKRGKFGCFFKFTNVNVKEGRVFLNGEVQEIFGEMENYIPFVSFMV